MFTAGCYIPLKHIMGAFTEGMSSYAQDLMPMIAIQAVVFAGVSAALRSANDYGRHQPAIQSQPITPLTRWPDVCRPACTAADRAAVSLVRGDDLGLRFDGDVANRGLCLLV